MVVGGLIAGRTAKVEAGSGAAADLIANFSSGEGGDTASDNGIPNYLGRHKLWLLITPHTSNSNSGPLIIIIVSQLHFLWPHLLLVWLSFI